MRSFRITYGGTPGQFNEKANWIYILETEYCKNVIQNDNCTITIENLEKTISKLQIEKSPGNDLNVGYWYKHLKLYIPELSKMYDSKLKGTTEIPEWLAKTKTTLLPKNDETMNPKNYRPIALQNIMLKLYTSCINQMLQNHCEMNNIITTEQAGGKKDVLGCFEQLLVNKTVICVSGG